MNLREQAHEHLRHALELQAMDLARALEHLRQAVFLDPELAAAHFALGDLLLRTDAVEEGVRHLRLAVQAAPDNALFSQRLASLDLERDSLECPQDAADLRFDLVPREGHTLPDYQLLEQATIGNWIDVEYTCDMLIPQATPRTVSSLLVHCAMAHLVAARRRLRFALPVLPNGPARTAAVDLIPTCADLFADLRRMEAPADVDPMTEANRLARLGDSLHDDPDRAIAHYRQALRLTPDHAPAHFGLFVVMRATGDVPSAAEHLLRAIELSPGNSVYRYYYNAWRTADLSLSALLPSIGDDDGAQRPQTALRRLSPAWRSARDLSQGRTTRVPMELPLLDLTRPAEARRALDDLFDQGDLDQLLAYAFRLLGRIDARRETRSSGPNERATVQIVSHVAARAHLNLALGFLQRAHANYAARGAEARTHMTIVELGVARLSGAA